MPFDDVIQKVDRYYTGRLREHGPTARGADWNSEASQELRFEQLARLLPGAGRFTILDYGCGYGALAQYLATRRRDFGYCGYDISEEMIRQARERLGDRPECRFSIRLDDFQPADFTVASGIFNVRLDTEEDRWKDYVLQTLHTMARWSRRGFAFNVLTSYSDVDRRRPDLFYADPLYFFDFCVRSFSRHVAVLHDYPLYEFTLLVRLPVAGEEP